MFIEARMVEKDDKIEVRNPYTGEVVGTVSSLERRDIEDAVAAAGRYNFSLSGYERYEILSKAALELLKRKSEFADLIVKEIGAPLKTALHEVERTFNVMVLSAEESKRLNGEVLSPDISAGQNDYLAMVIREPVGIVLCITPFNHPLNQVAHKVSPAIAANNAVILKPTDKAPLSAIKFAELLIRNGLPPTMLQVITGYNDRISLPLIEHPDINMISFTGSTKIGEYISRSCGLKKLSLELGGNDAFIVLPDADLEKASDVAVPGAFGNAGQMCSSIKRIIVFPENVDGFARLLTEKTKRLVVGDPADISTDIGTVVNEEAAKTIERRIDAAVKDGARLLAGGKRQGAQIWPAVLDEVKPESELVKEETFGPVAPIIRVDSLEEAIETANNTVFALNAAVMTNSLKDAMDLARRLNAGGIRINEAPSFRNEYIPFGGNKMSGFGRSGIKCAVREMTNEKTIIVKQ